jgi:ribosomal protein L44E
VTNPANKNRRLTEAERVIGHQVLENVRHVIAESAKGDAALAWALRRFVYVRLSHDERSSPMQRKLLKLNKMIAQKGLCAECGEELPKRGSELDRFNAMDGYTDINTRLVCHKCHRKSQEEKGFA